MNNNRLLYGIGGLVLGLLISGLFASYAVNNNRGDMMRIMGIRSYGDHMMTNGDYTKGNNNFYDNDDQNGMAGAMEGMMSGLLNKDGDEFDQAFISEMIKHHQGAISMANAALSSAKHQELKDLAKSIIDAQTKEIDQMRQWQQTWYK